MALSWRTTGALARLRNYSGALEHIKRTAAYARGNHVGFTPIGRRIRSFNCMKMDPETKIISIWFYGSPNRGYANLQLHPSGRVDLRGHKGWTYATESEYLAYLMGWEVTTVDGRHYLRARNKANETQWVQFGGKGVAGDRPTYRHGIWSSYWVNPDKVEPLTAPTLYANKPRKHPLEGTAVLAQSSLDHAYIQPKASCVTRVVNREAMRPMRKQFATFLKYTKAMCALRGWNDTLDEDGVQQRSATTDREEYRPFFGEREVYLWRQAGGGTRENMPAIPAGLNRATTKERDACEQFLAKARSSKPEDMYHAFLWIIADGAYHTRHGVHGSTTSVAVSPHAHRARLTRALLVVHHDKLLVTTPVAGRPKADRYNCIFA